MSKFKQRRKRVRDLGWGIVKSHGYYWIFHDTWHPLAAWERAETLREAVNKVWQWECRKKLKANLSIILSGKD